ncbi:MAG: hypothetical protein KA004_17105 [Verrucomicrobiales bacterium]|nr:hypothetical protein [Verrucomicrobiales bacterium]
MSKSTRGKSFAQAMNEWSAQKSFVKRLRSRVLFPSYDAPWYAKCWGYLWRLAMTGLFLSLLFYVFLKLHHKHPSFRGHLAEEAARLLHGTDATCGLFKWPLFTSEMSINSLGMNGTRESFFTRLDAHGIQAEVGWQAIQDDWRLETVKVGEAVIQLKSGGEGAAEAAPAATPVRDRVAAPPEIKTGAVRPSPNVLAAGFSLRPDFSRLSVERIEFADLTMRWGYSTTTAGALENCVATMERDATGYNLVATSGTFSQNWLRGLTIKELDAHVGTGTIEIRKASFESPNGGLLALAGSISLGEMPEANLVVKLKDVDLKRLTPAPFDKYFNLLASADGTITGSINRQSGIRTKLHVNMTGTGVKGIIAGSLKNGDNDQPPRGLLNNVPVLRALYVAATENKLIQVSVNEGQFDLESGGGELVLNNLDIRSGDLLRLRGAMAFQQSITRPPADKPGEEAPPPRLIAKAKGDLLIGLSPATVGEMPPSIQKQYFPQESEGFRWMRTTFQDEDGESLTSGIAEEINRLNREYLGSRTE